MIRCDVAIAGAGFSGTMVAAHLARADAGNLAVTVFEPGAIGRGAAYGTPCSAHLLNTRASAMSAFPDEPEHFMRWLGAGAAADGFASRRLYGEYVAEIASRALQCPRFGVVRDRIVSIGRDGAEFELLTASGTRFSARCVVVATGNAAPDHGFLPPQVVRAPGYVGDPWRHDFRTVGGHVLLIGTGLTALDVLVALESAGHRGAVTAVSRLGRFPQVHADGLRPLDVTPVLETSDSRAVLRSFRRSVRDASERGYDWRCVVDALRAESEALWRRLPPLEQRRFDRHLRSRWERYRHRAPQAADAVRTRYQAAGRLTVVAGRVAGAAEGWVALEMPAGSRATLRPDWVVNCTGPGRERALSDTLLAGLTSAGLVSVDPLRIGVRVDARLRAVGNANEATPGLWIAGPLARGSRFEATAVPELRVMAQTVAAGVLDHLKKAAPSGRRFLDAEAIL